MAVQDDDKFLINRGGTDYKVSASAIDDKLQDDDEVLIHRSGTDYKVSGLDLREYLGIVPMPWENHDGVVWHILNKSEPINQLYKSSYELGSFQCYDINGNDLGLLSKIEPNQEVIMLTPKDCAYLFQKNQDADWEFGHLQNTSLAANFTCTFKDCKKFTGDVSNWDVGNVRQTYEMFRGCALWNSDLSNWKLAPRRIDGMFRGCSEFDSKGLNNWDVSQCSNFEWTFCDTKFDDTLEDWDVSNVKSFSWMFYGASKFKGIGLDKWNVSNQCTKMNSMFYEATDLTSIDLRGWNTSSVTDMSSAFFGTTSFNGDISTWKTGEVHSMRTMFYRSAFNGDISQWDTGKVTNLNSFAKDATNFNCDVSKWNTGKVADFNGAFANCVSFNCDLSDWNTSSCTDERNMQNMFYGCKAFNQDLSQWCVSNIPGRPISFDTNADAWTLPRPVWGTCPRGEDKP